MGTQTIENFNTLDLETLASVEGGRVNWERWGMCVFLFVAFYAVADQDQHLAVGGATLVVGNYVEFIEHGVVYSDG